MAPRLPNKNLILFQKAAQQVPAYADFLKRRHFKPSMVKNEVDWLKIPLTDKKSYLNQYQLRQLFWPKALAGCLVYTATSGSTGLPSYFPRTSRLDWQYSLILENFLKQSSRGPGPTLIIIGFGMGVWIGGLITYQAFEMAARRAKLPVSIITPGINKEEIFKALAKLSPLYKQTVLVGYPPFVKNIVDEALARGLNLKKHNLCFLLAAEAFTENFRDYLVKKAAVKNRFLDTLNIYGSADLGAMAFETPLSILIRTFAAKDQNLFKEIFSGINKTPTLVQYNPDFIHFESLDGNLVLTGDSALPLVRYALGDHGGVIGFADMLKLLKKHGLDIIKAAKKSGLAKTIKKFPFVYVYERADFSASLYGINIFPEYIKEALLGQPLLTGRFTMSAKFDSRQNQYLEINVETRKKENLKKARLNKIEKTVIEKLRKVSSEFRELSNHMPGRRLVLLKSWPLEHPLYFRPGLKQKWIQK